jgi:D-2-hydroxyacid dehydrogenase (NADP+)
VTTILIYIHHPEYALWNLPEGLAEQWQRELGERGARIVAARDPETFARELPSADALVGSGLTPELFATAERLRWVQAPSAGVRHLLFPPMREGPVILTNARGVHAVPMAEHALALLLGLVRKIHRARDFQREAVWSQDELTKEEPYFDEVNGRALGVVGLGAVGSALAERAAALGMRVLAVRRRPEHGGPAEEVRGVEALPWLLESSDVVANCLPHTDVSKHTFDATAFRRMRPGAYFLNLGRGSTVVEADLLAALESERLAGVGLDVTAEEPLPKASALYSHPRVLLTPHVAGASKRYWKRAAALFRENMERFLDGRSLLNVVDKAHGY